MNKISISEDFKDFLTALKPDEYDRLKESLKSDGCRDPLVVWASENILIDGHNRFEICEKFNIPYTVKKIQFDNDDAVKAWIINNQLSRRNLSRDEVTRLIGIEYKLEKKPEHDGGKGKERSGVQNEPHLSTAEKIAEKHNVSPATVKRAEKYVDAIEDLKEVAPELNKQITAGTAPNKLTIIKAAEVVTSDPEKAKEILTNKPEPRKEVKKTSDFEKSLIKILGALIELKRKTQTMRLTESEKEAGRNATAEIKKEISEIVKIIK